MNRAWIVVMGGAVALVLAACGGSSSSTTSQSTPQSALKSYDLAWAEGNAKEACNLLADQARTAVETEMSNRTLSGLPLNCPARMKELLELLGPAAKAQLKQLAERASADSLEERGGESLIQIAPENFMGLTEIAGDWYIVGGTISELEPLVVSHVEGEEAGETEAEEPEEEAFSEEEGAAAAEEDGIIDSVRQEKAIEETLGIEFHEPVTYVSCPAGVAAETGETYTCLAAMESGKRFTLEYRVTDPLGHLSELSQEPNREY